MQPRKRVKYPRFNPKPNMQDPKFQIGQTFIFMMACKSHNVAHGRRIKFFTNDGKRATAYCKDGSWKFP